MNSYVASKSSVPHPARRVIEGSNTLGRLGVMIDCRCVPAAMAVQDLVLLCPQFSVVLGCSDYRTGETVRLSRLGDCSILRHPGPEHTAIHPNCSGVCNEEQV